MPPLAKRKRTARNLRQKLNRERGGRIPKAILPPPWDLTGLQTLPGLPLRLTPACLPPPLRIWKHNTTASPPLPFPQRFVDSSVRRFVPPPSRLAICHSPPLAQSERAAESQKPSCRPLEAWWVCGTFRGFRYASPPSVSFRRFAAGAATQRRPRSRNRPPD